jgi:hypothetical protein
VFCTGKTPKKKSKGPAGRNQKKWDTTLGVFFMAKDEERFKLSIVDKYVSGTTGTMSWPSNRGTRRAVAVLGVELSDPLCCCVVQAAQCELQHTIQA